MNEREKEGASGQGPPRPFYPSSIHPSIPLIHPAIYPTIFPSIMQSIIPPSQRAPGFSRRGLHACLLLTPPLVVLLKEFTPPYLSSLDLLCTPPVLSHLSGRRGSFGVRTSQIAQKGDERPVVSCTTSCQRPTPAS